MKNFAAIIVVIVSIAYASGAIVKDEKQVLAFHENLRKAKEGCGQQLGFQPDELKRPLLYKENLTQREKTLIECVLKKTKMMDTNNKINVESVGRLAAMVSANNPVVINVAVASAQKCNSMIPNQMDRFEAAAIINQCIATEMKTHKVKMLY